MDVETLKSVGFPVACAVAMSWYIWRMTQYLLTDFKSAIDEMKKILIQLINAKNEQTKSICDVEQRVAEIREQQRYIVAEFRLKEKNKS